MCIGDTMGPGGIFRAARTIPVLVDIARDMEKHCPNAVMLNYTNPMYLLCRAMHRTSSTRMVGLCHSVQGSAEHLARIMKIDFNDCDYWVAGINHQAWFLEYSYKGKDMLPRIRKEARDNKDWWRGDTTRVEMCRNLGYYITESSGHNSEYNPWFRKNKKYLKKYAFGQGFHGASGFIKDIYGTNRKTYMKWMRNDAAAKEFDLARGHEYGSYIMNAMEGGGDCRFYGTVPNTGLIDNLPPESAVEVPILAEKQGLRPYHVGSLPPQCAALNNQVVSSLELAVEAILEGDRDKLFWSIAYDPLTAAVLSLEDIRKMVDELYKAEKHLMPTFKSKARYKLVAG
jgi:alpha-galactosidase